MLYRTYMKSILTAVFSVAVANSFSCTTIVVGKDATQDGSVIIARNSDSGQSGMHAKRMVIHPHNTSSTDVIFASGQNGFTYNLGKLQYSYTGLPYTDDIFTKPPYNTEPYQYEQVGTNENNVSISATETISNNPAALKIDPYSGSGITENSIVSVIMAKATSAEQATKLLGHIIETQGTGEGFGVAIADSREAWYLETASGHNWVAVRIPDNSFFVAANQSRIQEINNPKSKTRFLYSADLIGFAQRNLGYNSASEPVFNARKYYGAFNNSTSKGADIYYNYPRIAELIRLYTGINYGYQLAGGAYPMFLVPQHKLSVNDVEKGLSDHYQNFPNDPTVAQHDPYYNQNPAEMWRPASVFRVSNSHVTAINGNKPDGIKSVEYITLGMQDLSFYVPFYSGITQVPNGYESATTGYADNSSAFWKFRKLQVAAMLDYPRYAPELHDLIQEYNHIEKMKQARVEEKYTSAYENGASPEKLSSILNKFTERNTDNLLNTVVVPFTKLILFNERFNPKTYYTNDDWWATETKNIFNTYPFEGS